jgi:hypothetical protein
MQLVLATMVAGKFKGIDIIDMKYFWKRSIAYGLSTHAIHQEREEYAGK